MFGKIMVPLDGSKLAERALGPAVTLGRCWQAQLLLVRVPVYRQLLVPGASGYGMFLPEAERQDSRSEVNAYLQACRSELGYPRQMIQTRQASGDVAGTIVDMAMTEAVDLIVMTTHGYSGFTRWMLGSVTERVLRSAPCPVLALRTKSTLQRMVVTLDGSALSEQALEPGLALARGLGAEVTLVRVDQEADLNAVEMSLLSLSEPELSRHLATDDCRAGYYLECLAEKYGGPDFPVATALLSGLPAQGILAYVDRHDVDLVVMATHGYTGLRRWVYGSVTEKVLRGLGCALLVVRPPADLLH
ncbi:MAG: universal stress protein [Candidatus Promineifilaceae bacterium]|nr:universal stress protein [Candidatus Promineifilaceae bacterium]